MWEHDDDPRQSDYLEDLHAAMDKLRSQLAREENVHKQRAIRLEIMDLHSEVDRVEWDTHARERRKRARGKLRKKRRRERDEQR